MWCAQSWKCIVKSSIIAWDKRRLLFSVRGHLRNTVFWVRGHPRNMVQIAYRFLAAICIVLTLCQIWSKPWGTTRSILIYRKVLQLIFTLMSAGSEEQGDLFKYGSLLNAKISKLHTFYVCGWHDVVSFYFHFHLCIWYALMIVGTCEFFPRFGIFFTSDSRRRTDSVNCALLCFYC